MTPKPATVHQAKPEDEDFLFALICTSGNEWSMGRQNPAKVRNVIHLATHGGPPPRPVFGVVRGPAMIEGAVGLYPTEPWDSTEPSSSAVSSTSSTLTFASRTMLYICATSPNGSAT